MYNNDLNIAILKCFCSTTLGGGCLKRVHGLFNKLYISVAGFKGVVKYLLYISCVVMFDYLYESCTEGDILLRNVGGKPSKGSDQILAIWSLCKCCKNAPPTGHTVL